jgi:phosphoglycerate dehydrogenase-like enzyme
MKLRLLVTLPTTSRDREYASGQLDGTDLRFAEAPSDSELAWAQALLGNLHPSRIIDAPGLKWVHSPNVGLDAYSELPALRPDIRLTNSQGVMDHAVAEHALALLLALSRQLPLLAVARAEQTWARKQFRDGGQGRVLAGCCAHLLGFGSIAACLAAKLHGIGMSVTAYRRRGAGDSKYIDEFLPLSELRDHVNRADVLVNLLPANPDTLGIVNHEIFAAMRPEAFFVNVGRGATVDEQALAEALRAGHLAGAALDVFATEPLPEDSPLWRLANIVISPHVAGRFNDEVRRHIDAFTSLLRK